MIFGGIFITCLMLMLITVVLNDIRHVLNAIAGEIQTLRLHTHTFRQQTPMEQQNWPPRSG